MSLSPERVDLRQSVHKTRESSRGLSHHFTVDVEEYFQVSAFEPHVPRSQWLSLESRVVDSTRKLLNLLAEGGSRGTFFVLGWIAERHPALVRDLVCAGHEVASHGWDHRRVTHQNPEDFRDSVRRSKAVIENITGLQVQGFRAPSFSIVPGREWALDILIEEGYAYDSSLFPVRRSGYGYASGQRDPHWINRPAGRIAEVPPATLRRAGVNIPAAGGAYLRLLPYALVQSALKDCEHRGEPGTFYIHPWELDPEQPRFRVGIATRIRHYAGLESTAGRLKRILAEFQFRPVLHTVVELSHPCS